MDEVAQQVVGLAELDPLQPGQQLAEQVSKLHLGKLVPEAEVGSATAEAQVWVG